jgi:CheY-like chemotaxis protein
MMTTENTQVLCVEDNADSRRLLEFLLTLEIGKINVCGVGSAAEAMDQIENREFDLYILDRRLPDMDGAELCRWIRGRSPSKPIMFYSGIDGPRDLNGANAYLSKPADLEYLASGVKNLLGTPLPGSGIQ